MYMPATDKAHVGFQGRGIEDELIMSSANEPNCLQYGEKLIYVRPIHSWSAQAKHIGITRLPIACYATVCRTLF